MNRNSSAGNRKMAGRARSGMRQRRSAGGGWRAHTPNPRAAPTAAPPSGHSRPPRNQPWLLTITPTMAPITVPVSPANSRKFFGARSTRAFTPTNRPSVMATMAVTPTSVPISWPMTLPPDGTGGAPKGTSQDHTSLASLALGPRGVDVGERLVDRLGAGRDVDGS